MGGSQSCQHSKRASSKGKKKSKKEGKAARTGTHKKKDRTPKSQDCDASPPKKESSQNPKKETPHQDELSRISLKVPPAEDELSRISLKVPPAEAQDREDTEDTSVGPSDVEHTTQSDDAIPPPPPSFAGPILGKRKQRPQLGTSDEADFVQYVEARQELYIERLREFVAIQSVSADVTRRPDQRKAVDWAADWCNKFGGATRIEELGDGLPPVLLSQFGTDPNKQTLLIYGHLDVQPASRDDGWNTEPFVLTEIDGKLYGRGSTDDKGPCCAWLWVVETYHEKHWELPVNIRFIFECMEESGSEGLPKCCERLAAPGEFLDPAAIDFIVIADTMWSNKTKPCLTHALRGLASFVLEVRGSSQDLHSGGFGGTVHEALNDCFKLMATMVDNRGKILIDGIYDDAVPYTEEIAENFRNITFNAEEFAADSGAKLINKSEELTLKGRWQQPTLSFHGIEGAFCEPGLKTVIPACVKFKFSLRLVPNMIPEKVGELVQKHVDKEAEKLATPNLISLQPLGAGLPWIRSVDDPNFRAAAAATERVYGMKPDFTREGGSIPMTQVLEDLCEATCVHLCFGVCDDGAHAQNEKLNISSYMNGIKVFGAYLEELARLPREPDEIAKAAIAAAAASRMESNRWRRECKLDIRYGCDCLECQVP